MSDDVKERIDSADTDVDVLLADGTTARVREIRPDDADALVAFHGGLSHQTVVFRYFGPHPVLSESEVEHFSNVDGVDRVALVAERAGAIVAVARYDRGAGQDEAEVAFVVGDELQGKGVGTVLLEHLVEAARRHGIRRFVAETLSENYRMLRLLRDAGFARQYERSSGVTRVVLDISPSLEALQMAEERDRTAVVHSIDRMLRPGSIAVIGAARTRGTIGHQLLSNLIAGGFEGPVYPVNPSASHVASVPCWPSVGAIAAPIDLALIAVPAGKVGEVVEECGRKGVGALVVISAGFAETGPDGALRQRDLTRLAHSYGMRLLGPNCFGVVNTDVGVSMNATFAPSPPIAGSLGFVSQSGGLGIALLREISARGLGLSAFVSTGNKADISGNDLLMWWEQDPATKVVLMYLESFGNPRKFRRIAERLSRSKPIIAVKSGRSAAGTRGAASHTAALASPEDAVDALFRRTGVIRVDTIEELFDVAQVLADCPLPRGGRVGIVTNAGGPGVLAADACVSHGLDVPELSTVTQEALRTFSDPGAGLGNPVDMIASASAETYRRTIELLLRGDEVDALLVIFTPPLVTRADDVEAAVVAAVSEANRSGNAKPVLASFLGAAEAPPSLGESESGVPTFTYPETAARALSRVVAYSRWLERPTAPDPVLDRIDVNAARRLVEDSTVAQLESGAATIPGARQEWITGEPAMALLASYAIPVVQTVAVTSAREARETAERVGFPVALKAAGTGILHKSEVGGVRLSIAAPGAVAKAYDEMKRTLGDSMHGAIIQRMVPPGVEVIAGFLRDPAFGPLVLFGLGGTTVELLGDHATRLAPLTEQEARELVLGLRGSRLFTGFRGSEPVDLDALVDVLVRLARLADDLPELAEGDCNPVIASAQGAVVVDARLRVQPMPADRHLEARRLS